MCSRSIIGTIIRHAAPLAQVGLLEVCGLLMADKIWRRVLPDIWYRIIRDTSVLWYSGADSLCRILTMPEISRFLGIVITMFYNDHEPPHFHAVYGESAVTISIHDGSVKGDFPKRALRLV
jgi:hypothetical protein